MNSPEHAPDEYQLGSIRIKAKQNVLVTEHGDITVLPKVMSLLLYFCQKGQNVVTFDELNAAIWPREIVGDNAIYNLVGQTRKALGDNASKPIYIQTVSKVGYRLLVDAIPISEVLGTNSPQDTHQNKSTVEKVRKPRFAPATFVPGLLISLAAIVVIVFSLFPSNQDYSQESLRLLQLARYQLYRGDEEGLTEAIDHLQQLFAVEPDWSVPKIELAYSFIRKAHLEPDNREFWLTKASAISEAKDLGDSGKRLKAIIDSTRRGTHSNSSLMEPFSTGNILVSEYLAYSDVLFHQGKSADAANQAKHALDNCMDCPYAYRKYATTQLVLGNVDEAFKSFGQYRMLIHQTSDNPANLSGFVPMTRQTLKDMVSWYANATLPEDLLPHQRNNLALFYLTLGQIEKAENIVSSAPDTATGFFDLYTHAAIAGAKSQLTTSLQLLQKRQQDFPDNQRFKLSVVYAQWQLGKYQEAMQAFKQFKILGSDHSQFPGSTSLPEFMNFNEWSLYAALLTKTGDPGTDQYQTGQQILAQLEQQLKAGASKGRQTADISLTSILALQGKKQQALEALKVAITQGWVSDFNQNWWYLQDSPYFQDMADDEVFKQIVDDYHQSIEREFGE